MKRLLAIALVLLFGLPLFSPLLAQGGDVESSLPACCRRAGAHHCAMTMEQAAAQVAGTRMAAQQGCCPAYPRAVSPSSRHDLSFGAAQMAFAEAVAHPAVRRQVEARARVALDQARQKRGPPVDARS